MNSEEREITSKWADHLVWVSHCEGKQPISADKLQNLIWLACEEYRMAKKVPQYDKELELATKEIEALKAKLLKFEKSEKQAIIDKERAERMTLGIKREAQGYRDDHMKAVNWLCDNGFGEACGNPTEDIIKLLRLARGKNLSQSEYIAELEAELNEVVGMAYVHGWRSTRFESGEKLRKEISILTAAEEALKKCH